jgi:hypothetical protein
LDKRPNQIGVFINPPGHSTGHHRSRQLGESLSFLCCLELCLAFKDIPFGRGLMNKFRLASRLGNEENLEP